MKILFISDTHTQERGIPKSWLPEADVIVHGGDIMGSGYKVNEITNFLDWYSGLEQYKHKIFIAGNHDRFIENSQASFKEILKSYPNIIYLQDSEIVIDGVKFYGSPWQPWFYNWAFNAARRIEETNSKYAWIKNYWDMIPMDTDVLITHGPPYGILDANSYGEPCGCEELLTKVNKVKPYIHVFGHIHEGYGVKKNGKTEFINASVLDGRYNMRNKPIISVIDVNPKLLRKAYEESTCQKRIIICQILDAEGNVLSTESNRCNPTGGVCHRIGLNQSKDNYDVDSPCNWKHAEIRAIEAIPPNTKPHSAILYGHAFVCNNCENALKEIGVTDVKIIETVPYEV